MTATGYASGKVILLGEHAVVFGHSALAAALPFGVRMQASPASEGVTLTGKDVPSDPRVAEATARIAAVMNCSGARVAVASELPAGGGLGSSAAFAVALARALGALGGRVESEKVVEAVFASERLFHGRPSGVDQAACSQTGVILFRRGEPAEIRTVKPKRCFRLVLGLTGKARLTGSKVASLSVKRAENPACWDPLLERLGVLAEEGAKDLESGDLPSLGQRMNEAHGLLARCELSSPELDEIVRAARNAGALGAKLTGAGGGGAAVALVEEPESVVRAIERAGFETRVVVLGETR